MSKPIGRSHLPWLTVAIADELQSSIKDATCTYITPQFFMPYSLLIRARGVNIGHRERERARERARGGVLNGPSSMKIRLFVYYHPKAPAAAAAADDSNTDRVMHTTASFALMRHARFGRSSSPPPLGAGVGARGGLGSADPVRV